MNKYESIKSFQDTLIDMYNYKPLPQNVRDMAYIKYVEALPVTFSPQRMYHLLDKNTKGSLLPIHPERKCSFGYEIYPIEQLPVYSKNGTKIANKYERIVIGDYGVFLEIKNEDIIKENIKVKEGQEYRIKHPKYAKNIKYQWFTTKDESNCKLYYQQKEVNYADYKPGYWYISPYEVLEKEEVEAMIMQNKEEEHVDYLQR